ncbi:hypothetical protein ACK3ZJ_19640 [Aeromonas caviae]
MIIGNEVVASPGQGLTATELDILLLHGEGECQGRIMAASGLSQAELHMAEKSIRAKLGAKTATHMISRAFQLGILASRALCLVLALASTDYQDGMKNRSPIKGGRPGTIVVRIKTGGRNIWA